MRARESTCHLTCGFHRPFSLSFFPPLSAQQNTQPQAQDAAGASRARAKDEVQAEDRSQELEDRCKELKAQRSTRLSEALGFLHRDYKSDRLPAWGSNPPLADIA